MIRLAVEGKLSADRGELDDLARHLDRVGTRTLRTALDLDWTGEQVEMVRQYLEERDIRVGEAAGLYHGLAHPDKYHTPQMIYDDVRAKLAWGALYVYYWWGGGIAADSQDDHGGHVPDHDRENPLGLHNR